MAVTEVRTTKVIEPAESISTVNTVNEVNPIYRTINSLIWLFFGLIEFLIILRIIFKMLGARYVGFTQFLYNFTDIFVAPFKGIFPTPAVEGFYFDTAAVLSLLLWLFVAWGLTALVRLIGRSV